MNIAFCINTLGLAGLGVTLSSLLRNCSNPNKLHIWFLCANLSSWQKSKIRKLLLSEKFSGMYNFIDFDPILHFGKYNSLHGDWSTYGRLLLPDIIMEDTVLYLDSDLIVEVDVLELDKFNFNQNILAAVGGGYFKFTLGNKFYIDKLGLSSELEYFNAGILLLNLIEWRLKNVKEECLQIADQFPKDLPSHDQSLLNIYCAGKFAKLPLSYNCAWLADKPKPTTAEKMILHFVGSPKPWDPLGFIIHKGYCKWKEYLNPEWTSLFDRLALANYKRAWQIRRSYIRYVRNRVRSYLLN